MSKGIPEEEYSGTYIGITAFSADVQSRFFRTMERWIAAGKVNEFFNVAVQDLADQGHPRQPNQHRGLALGRNRRPLGSCLCTRTRFS
jgi:hypothetical protein